MEQNYKRYKGSQKHFNLWMLSETEDFYPTQIPNDPLKKITEILNSRPTNPEQNSRETQKKTRVLSYKTVKCKVSFDITNYWKQFAKSFNNCLLRFLDVKDIIALISTCKCFQEIFDHDVTWTTLIQRDFYFKEFQNGRPEEIELRQMKLYYRYLYQSTLFGIPYHSGYFKAYGNPEVAKLALNMVDFMIPKGESVKESVREIMVRNSCRMPEIRLSWMKETGEICLWSADYSMKLEEKEVEEERGKGKKKIVEKINKFFPCFIKKYLLSEEEAKAVEEVYFLEDRFLVIKLRRNIDEIICRVLDLEDEFYSIARGLDAPVPFDYLMRVEMDQAESILCRKMSDESVSFVVNQAFTEVKLKLLQKNQAVFFTTLGKKDVVIYSDLKEKKEIASMEVDLEAPIYDIIISKKQKNHDDGMLQSFILDEDMNVYCAELSSKGSIKIIKKILIPKKEEDDEEGIEDGEEEVTQASKLDVAYESKKNRRSKYHIWNHQCRPGAVKTLVPHVNEDNINRFEDNIKRYYHGIFETKKGQEEWLIVNSRSYLYFINLETQELEIFEENIGELQQRNWNIYNNKLIITSPTHVFCLKISFEDRKLVPVFYRYHISTPLSVAMEWIEMDSCFTILILGYPHFTKETAKLTIIVTSTQEFLHNDYRDFNSIYCLFEANHLVNRPERWDLEKTKLKEKLDVKFQDEKLLITTEKGNFYFDLSVTESFEEKYKEHLEGWYSGINQINYKKVEKIRTEVETEIEGGEVLEKPKERAKFVNYMKLEENKNSAGTKEKGNGWSKNGKDEMTKEKVRAERVLKGKGDKYHKNIRQNQRNNKVHS